MKLHFMTVKRRFGRFSGVRQGFLALGLALAACQSAPNSGNNQKAESVAEFDFQQAMAQVSGAELPNGGLGWVTVTVPVKSQGRLAGDLEIEGQLVENSPAGAQKNQSEEDGKPEQVKLVFFEANRVDEKSSGARVFHAFLPIPYLCPIGPARVLMTLKNHQAVKELEASFQVVRGKYSSEKLRVDPRRVHPPKQDLVRIAGEVKEIGVVYRTLQKKKFWQGPFELPIRSEVTSAFGTRRVYNGSLQNFHTGLDLRAPVGTPINAAAPGRVALAKDLFFTGNTVIVDHGYGLMTLYAHLSEIKVKKGDLVDPQQLLGLSGKTGRVNGPHLHWMAIVNGIKVNPVSLTQNQVP